MIQTVATRKKIKDHAGVIRDYEMHSDVVVG